MVHVIGAGGTHAISNHLWLLYDFFHRELADDAAQMSFHHQANQSLALLISLGQKLLGCGQNGFGIRLHFDLRHRLDGDRDTLLGVEILLWRHIE